MKLKSCGTISLNLDEMSFSACTATSPRVHLEYSISSRRQMLLCFSDSLHLKHISMVLAGHEELEHTIFFYKDEYYLYIRSAGYTAVCLPSMYRVQAVTAKNPHSMNSKMSV